MQTITNFLKPIAPADLAVHILPLKDILLEMLINSDYFLAWAENKNLDKLPAVHQKLHLALSDNEQKKELISLMSSVSVNEPELQKLIKLLCQNKLLRDFFQCSLKDISSAAKAWRINRNLFFKEYSSEEGAAPDLFKQAEEELKVMGINKGFSY